MPKLEDVTIGSSSNENECKNELVSNINKSQGDFLRVWDSHTSAQWKILVLRTPGPPRGFQASETKTPTVYLHITTEHTPKLKVFSVTPEEACLTPLSQNTAHFTQDISNGKGLGGNT